MKRTNPKLVQNQYGAAGGGRILRDKTFFFGSFEGLRIRQNQIFNNAVPSPAMLSGDFSSLSKPIIDPTTGQPFPNNQIPADRFDAAAVSFFPYLLQPNAPDGNYHAVAPTKTDSTSGTARIDHVLTSKQHLYGRWVRYDSPLLFYGYSPKVYETNKTVQESYTLNYVYTISPEHGVQRQCRVPKLEQHLCQPASWRNKPDGAGGHTRILIACPAKRGGVPERRDQRLLGIRGTVGRQWPAVVA